ncbi:MAG: hypothetical protein Q8O83_01300 [bacterium]|nr:hypothetical protein [bacterium]
MGDMLVVTDLSKTWKGVPPAVIFRKVRGSVLMTTRDGNAKCVMISKIKKEQQHAQKDKKIPQGRGTTF